MVTMFHISVNWCQHWFEYYPLPPLNIMAMIENLLLEHDPELLNHLIEHDVTPEIYAWVLLEVAFSEVLMVSEWYIFWDHVLTNEPSFLLMAVVAYNILHRSNILSITRTRDFKHFYRYQNPLNIKRLVSKSYWLLHNTTEKNHPRLYLNLFAKLESGKYAQFIDYPQSFINFENAEEQNFKMEEKAMRKDEDNILMQRVEEQKKILSIQIEDEENERLQGT